MQNNSNSNTYLDELIADAVDKGLIYFSNSWIEKAVQQKARNMTLGLACSKFYVGVVTKESIN